MSQTKAKGKNVLEAKQKSDIGKDYMSFLNKYPEIFADLVIGADFNFAGYFSFEDFEVGINPEFIFHVLRTPSGIEIQPGRARDGDLELSLSINAVEKLIQSNSKLEYERRFGHFYNEPTEDQGWIDFVLKKRTQVLIDMGYGKFAAEAGILNEE